MWEEDNEGEGGDAFSMLQFTIWTNIFYNLDRYAPVWEEGDEREGGDAGEAEPGVEQVRQAGQDHQSHLLWKGYQNGLRLLN